MTMPIRFITKPGLVAYLTAGDPDLATSREIALAAIDAGADVIELGVPFSDPLAEVRLFSAPANAPSRVAHGSSMCSALAAELHAARPDAGLVIFSYFNPVLRFGLERFCAAAEKAGVDGVLITDMIVEEADEYLVHLRRTSSCADLSRRADQPRRAPAARSPQVSQGFVYAISRTGITGAQKT